MSHESIRYDYQCNGELVPLTLRDMDDVRYVQLDDGHSLVEVPYTRLRELIGDLTRIIDHADAIDKEFGA